MIVTTRTLSITLAALMLPAVAFAASEADMAKDVEQKCTDATSDLFRRSQVAVDPTGSESFGLAIVYGRSKAEKGPAAVICVYDKKTQKVEVGTELGSDLVRVRKPKPEGKPDQNAANKQGAADDTADDSDDQQ